MNQRQDSVIKMIQNIEKRVEAGSFKYNYKLKVEISDVKKEEN